MGNEHRDLLGRDVVAADGAKLGHVADVYVDPESGAPKWLVVPAGLFSGAASFVPADGAAEDEDGRILVAYTRKQIRKAPHPDPDGDLSPAEEADLARHYVSAARASAADSVDDELPVRTDPRAFDPTVETDLGDARDPSAAWDDTVTDGWLVDPGPSEESMVRAEEEVVAEPAPRPAQRARLVKRVVTEHVTITVPVRREVLHLEYEDIAEDEVVVPGSSTAPFAPVPDQEIVLYAEVVEYEKKIVPKERVRLQKEVVEEVVDLRTDVRKEEVDVVDAPSQPTLI